MVNRHWWVGSWRTPYSFARTAQKHENLSGSYCGGGTTERRQKCHSQNRELWCADVSGAKWMQYMLCSFSFLSLFNNSASADNVIQNLKRNGLLEFWVGGAVKSSSPGLFRIWRTEEKTRKFLFKIPGRGQDSNNISPSSQQFKIACLCTKNTASKSVHSVGSCRGTAAQEWAEFVMTANKVEPVRSTHPHNTSNLLTIPHLLLTYLLYLSHMSCVSSLFLHGQKTVL